ncbi:hypothetical protein BDB13_1195 [Rhodococcus sp. OK302]|nr:hypothetical protein BDB13_1195 [Rhodococcus sp. OK302]
MRPRWTKHFFDNLRRDQGFGDYDPRSRGQLIEARRQKPLCDKLFTPISAGSQDHGVRFGIDSNPRGFAFGVVLAMHQRALPLLEFVML